MTENICVITEEYSGLNKSGGIGSCCRGLAESLVRAGYSVDVLITDLTCASNGAVLRPLSGRGPRFIFLADFARGDKQVAFPADDIMKAYSVYRYLRNDKYRILHFNDWKGSGFYCAMAKRQGLLKSFVVTNLHGSSEWVRRHNLNAPELADFERESIERSQIENSDLVISPSDYLLDWCERQGVVLPEHRRLDWLLPQWLGELDTNSDERLTTEEVAPNAVSELIFFGRHERRKGFELFVDAVAQLPPRIQPDLTFIGRFDKIGKEFSGSYVFRRLPAYAGRIRFFNRFDQDGAIKRILHSPRSLCVMPSLIENSPCVVGECFTVGAPFLSTDVGGISELVDPDSRPYCLVEPDSKALALAIERVIDKGMPRLKSTLNPEMISKSWIDCHESIDAALRTNEQREPSTFGPLVSVCLTHYERPNLLRKAIERILEQTYDNIEILIVDDGSRRSDAHSYFDELESKQRRFPIKIIRSANRYLGAARNLAASHARGEYILFHDDDNLAELDEIEIFVRAAIASGNEILTSQYWMFNSNDGDAWPQKKKLAYFPIGIGGVFSFFRNRFGDANALIEKNAFERIGGFTELRGVGWEDWEFFLRAYIQGAKMGVVPEPLFNYRVSANGMLATGDAVANHERLYAMLDLERPKISGDLLRYAQKDLLERELTEWLSAKLGDETGGNLHRELASLEPNSLEARLKLSDLAFAIGRTADAIEIGAADVAQREKLLFLASKLERSESPTKYRQHHVAVESREGNDVVLLKGWAFGKHGVPYVPNRLLVEGDQFETLAHVRQYRPDVLDQFQFEQGEHLGFILVAKKTGVRSKIARYLGPKRKRVASHVNARIEFVSPTSPIEGHIDDLAWGREVVIPAPEPANWNDTITVDAANSAFILLKIGDEYRIGQQLSKTRARFTCSADHAMIDHSQINLILPNEGRTAVTFE
ncbi:MAG: hypothetical protein C3F11_12580 [Methylocystaceae bacterium]|nr:MAG: hypothetical protein C3F11_12580 [Methylocystaceae bacterium]